MDDQVFVVTLIVLVIILMAYLACLITVIALTDGKLKAEAIKTLGRLPNKLIDMIIGLWTNRDD